jgi:hypothetical protein
MQNDCHNQNFLNWGNWCILFILSLLISFNVIPLLFCLFTFATSISAHPAHFTLWAFILILSVKSITTKGSISFVVWKLEGHCLELKIFFFYQKESFWLHAICCNGIRPVYQLTVQCIYIIKAFGEMNCYRGW